MEDAMYMEIAGDDRETVEKLILANLWGERTVRLTADRDRDRYLVTLSTASDEPDVSVAATATPLS